MSKVNIPSEGMHKFLRSMTAKDLEEFRSQVFTKYAEATGVNGKITLGLNHFGIYRVIYHAQDRHIDYHTSDLALYQFKDLLTVKEPEQ